MRKGRGGGSSVSFSKEKETEEYARSVAEDREALLSFASFSFSCSSISTPHLLPPSYSPSICPSLSARMDACVVVCPMFAIPDGLIVVSLRSVRSTERLQHRALLSVHDGGHVHQGFLLFLIEEVDCCVPCSSITTRPIFSCGHPRKNHGRPRRSSNRTNGGDDRRGGHVASAAARRKGVLRLSAPRDSMTCRER